MKTKFQKKLLGAVIGVHKVPGPGLLENAYLECLFYKLQLAGLKAGKQKHLPLVYKEVMLEVGYRLDILVQKMLVV